MLRPAADLPYLRNRFPVSNPPSLSHEVLEVLSLSILYVLRVDPYRIALKAHTQWTGKVTYAHFPHVILTTVGARNHDLHFFYSGNEVTHFCNDIGLGYNHPIGGGFIA